MTAPHADGTPLTDAVLAQIPSTMDTQLDADFMNIMVRHARDLERDLTAARAEAYANRMRFDAAIKHMTHIHALMWPEPVESDGKRFKFHPPEELVRECWEGLSKAIREIPTAIDAARGKP